MSRESRSRLTAAAGWTAISLFTVIYAIELLPHHGRPATLWWIEETLGRGGLIAAYTWLALSRRGRRAPSSALRETPTRPGPGDSSQESCDLRPRYGHRAISLDL